MSDEMLQLGNFQVEPFRMCNLPQSHLLFAEQFLLNLPFSNSQWLLQDLNSVLYWLSVKIAITHIQLQGLKDLEYELHKNRLEHGTG